MLKRWIGSGHAHLTSFDSSLLLKKTMEMYRKFQTIERT